MVKRSIQQKLTLRNFDASKERIEPGAVVANRRGQQDSVREETNAVSGTTVMNVQHRQLHPVSHQHKEVEVRREKRTVRGRSQCEKFNRQPCKDHLKGIGTKAPCHDWHPPECHFYKSESGCKFGDKCSLAQWQVEGQPSKKTKRMLTKVQWVCVFQDTEPPNIY